MTSIGFMRHLQNVVLISRSSAVLISITYFAAMPVLCEFCVPYSPLTCPQRMSQRPMMTMPVPTSHATLGASHLLHLTFFCPPMIKVYLPPHQLSVQDLIRHSETRLDFHFFAVIKPFWLPIKRGWFTF